jgi:endoglucanase
MMKTTLVAAGLLALGLSSAAAQPGTPFGINGPLKTCGLYLCNQYGNPVQLRGMSTHGLQWYPWGDCLKDASLESLVKDWGADILRVSMYMQSGGWDTDKPRFTAMVDQIIEAATAKGLYVIIDFHQLSLGNCNDNLANATEYFNHMAPKHGPKGNVMYEICNEPNGGVKWASIKQYADKIIPVIRKHDAKSPILVGTMGWSSLGASADGPWTDITANPIVDPNHLYVFHFYATDHVKYHRDIFTAASAKLPLIVTEFGTQEASGDGPNDFTSGQAWMDLMAQKKISWVNWNFSDDFRSGAVLKANTCPNGPWTGSALKPAGTWIQDRMKTPDDFNTTPNTSALKGAAAAARRAGLRAEFRDGGIRIVRGMDGVPLDALRDVGGRRIAAP